MCSGWASFWQGIQVGAGAGLGIILVAAAVAAYIYYLEKHDA